LWGCAARFCGTGSSRLSHCIAARMVVKYGGGVGVCAEAKHPRGTIHAGIDE
jgi:hypothetical protein